MNWLTFTKEILKGKLYRLQYQYLSACVLETEISNAVDINHLELV